MQRKVLIIDGNNILIRAYFGIKDPMYTPDGFSTNAIYGFVNMMEKIIYAEFPDGLIITFDVGQPSFRHTIYDGYKANRTGMPRDLLLQLSKVKEVLDAMNICHLEAEGYEADDVMGTLARMCEAEDDECVITTGDKDMFQLISERTRVLHIQTRMGRTELVNYNMNRFLNNYRFYPINMIDLKALMGDKSDNIPGVPGIGEKTAMRLIQQFQTLGNVYANIYSPYIQPKVRRYLYDGMNSAYVSYELATIVTDVPLEFDLIKCFYYNNFKPELYDLFMELGFHTFIKRWGLYPMNK